MMRSFNLRFGIFIILLGVSMNCASSGQKTPQTSIDQSEEDVLKLLGITQEDEEGTDSDLQSRVTMLEEQLRQKEAEINELKSELVLKDERIAQQQAGRTQVTGTPMISGSYENQYRMALGQYQNGQYRDAISRFQSLLAQNMTHSLSDNCQYWIGESYYALRNFQQALIEFEKVFTFPKSNKDPDAQLKLGLCYWNLRDMQRAKEELNRLLLNYPNSEYTGKARSYLAQLGQ